MINDQGEEKSKPEDNWTQRNTEMRCCTCMHFVVKRVTVLGRCRRRAPTLNGWPAMYSNDWCGDHKLR